MSTTITEINSGRKVHMRNKLLSVTRNVVPYVKGLRQLPLLKSVVACLLMQQLDYWFERYPKGFYKFLEQPGTDHADYNAGDSWTEELGISADEFRTAFDQIGIRYKSKKEYDAAEDKFQGKYYCSYTDKVARLTHYFRNHVVVDTALDSLSAIEEGKGNLYNPTMPISRDGQGQAIETAYAKPDYTDTTAKTNTDNTQEREREPLSQQCAIDKELDGSSITLNVSQKVSTAADFSGSQIMTKVLLSGEEFIIPTFIANNKDNYELFLHLSGYPMAFFNYEEMLEDARNYARKSLPTVSDDEAVTIAKEVWNLFGIEAREEIHVPEQLQKLLQPPKTETNSLSSVRIDGEIERMYEDNDFDLEFELSRFKDYCLANGKKYSDYRRAFYCWLDKKIEHGW